MAEITEEEVKILFRKICTENPDRINPVEDDGDTKTCLYNGPNNTHCVAGTAFIALGCDPALFKENVGAAIVGAELGLWSAAAPVAKLFCDVQNLADGGSLFGDDFEIPSNQGTNGVLDPRPWGEVLRLATEHNIL